MTIYPFALCGHPREDWNILRSTPTSTSCRYCNYVRSAGRQRTTPKTLEQYKEMRLANA